MKLLTGLLKIAVPLIVIWLLLKLNIWLGIAAVIVLLGYWFYRNQSGFYAYLGNLNYQQGKHNEASMWLDKAVSRADCRAGHLLGYSFLLLKQGKLDKAEELLNRANRMGLNREEQMAYLTNISLLLWKLDRLDEATAKLEEAYDEYKNSNLYGTLGYFYILSGDLDKALSFNREAYQFNSKNGVIVDNLGQTLLLRGEYEEALQYYEELAEQKPTFPEAYLNHGLVLDALGRSREALERMKLALDHPLSLLSTVTREEIEEKLAALKDKVGAWGTDEETDEETDETAELQEPSSNGQK